MKYTKENLEEAVRQSVSVAGVCRFFGKNVSGSIHTYISKLIKRHRIDISHFTGLATNAGANHKGGPEKHTADDILVYMSNGDNREKTHKLVRALIEIGVEYKCIVCECDGTWQDKKIVLHVDHIDGNWKNNIKENLRYLCPNCHSQTSNYGNKKQTVCRSGGTVDTTVLEAVDP